jgi:hypothetical protein
MAGDLCVTFHNILCVTPFYIYCEMFRGGTPNPYDEIVGKHAKVHIRPLSANMYPTAKTTDENLTGENWELILNLCDKVQEEKEAGSVDSVIAPCSNTYTVSVRGMSSQRSSNA